MNHTQAQSLLNRNFIFQELYYTNYKTYALSVIFIAANVILPYALHQFHLAGNVFLPIYFFVLIAAYKFGWRVGIMTAIFSPLASFYLIAMPIVAILPFVIVKGILLAAAASFIARRSRQLTVFNIIALVVFYQVLGSGLIYLFSQNIALSLMDFKVGYIGLLLQAVGGYLILLLISNYGREKLAENN